MSDRFTKFVSEHRPEFDTREPGKDLLEKIDARLELSEQSRISSKWLSRLKYLGFSLSMLVAVIWFISKHQSKPSANALRQIATSHSGQSAKIEPYKASSGPGQSHPEKTMHHLSDTKQGVQHLAPVFPAQNQQGAQEKSEGNEHDRVLDQSSTTDEKEAGVENTTHTPAKEPGATKNDPSDGARKSTPLTSRKKLEIVAPAEPVDINSYTGTLYESASLCAVLHVYRFPGKVNLDKGGGISREDENYRTTLKTMSCNNLQNIGNVKAIWLKGRTDKELTLSVKKKFKNILLVKRDGREQHPDAISHYYPGLGVLSEFKGRYFNMVFKDKVELILFFKDAEEGDKVFIDGIEATVKAQQ